MPQLQVCMLGEFSLSFRETQIVNTTSRSKKVWVLLAYLICNRGRFFSQQKLIDLLWGGDPASSNPENALRITLHRLRALLDQLWPGAGRELILNKEGGYGWVGDFPLTLDCDRFDALCQKRQTDPNISLEELLEALSLYRGEFLPRHSSEMWVIPISTHFQNQFLLLSMDAASRLTQQNRHEEAAAICRRAAQSEPYHEPLHQLWMQTLAASGDQKAAAAVYDNLSKRLFDDFGIRPSEQTRNVYRTVAHSPEDRTLPMDEVLEYLQEPAGNSGAMQCDYDYFKVLCYAESRAMERSGNTTHVALLSVSGTDKPLTKRSQSKVMEQLGQSLRMNLRRGDTISQCSVSQYIIMLPKANYEDSCMVCRRLIAAFNRANPHTAVKLHYMVQPLTPSISVP